MSNKCHVCIMQSMLIIGCLGLSGCVTPHQTMYYWGDYQNQVYKFLSKNNNIEEQIAKLEADLEKARATGKTVPPGYNAHLGILYGSSAHEDMMYKYFATEKALYPESATYIDFLLRKFNQEKKEKGNAV